MDEAKKFELKLTKKDWIAIGVFLIFLIIVAIPIYAPKGECEIAQAGNKCASIKNVMIENCEYWSEFDCDTASDVSLPQIEWYIENLCNLQNQYHGDGLDCNNLKSACNVISDQQLC